MNFAYYLTREYTIKFNKKSHHMNLVLYMLNKIECLTNKNESIFMICSQIQNRSTHLFLTTLCLPLTFHRNNVLFEIAYLRYATIDVTYHRGSNVYRCMFTACFRLKLRFPFEVSSDFSIIFIYFSRVMNEFDEIFA